MDDVIKNIMYELEDHIFDISQAHADIPKTMETPLWTSYATVTPPHSPWHVLKLALRGPVRLVAASTKTLYIVSHVGTPSNAGHLYRPVVLARPAPSRVRPALGPGHRLS